MNRIARTLVLTTLALAAAAAGAAGHPVAAAERSAVVAQVLKARAAGTLIGFGEQGMLADEAVAASPRSRAEVVAEMLAARAAGTLVAAGEQGELRPAAGAALPGVAGSQRTAVVGAAGFTQLYGVN